MTDLAVLLAQTDPNAVEQAIRDNTVLVRFVYPTIVVIITLAGGSFYAWLTRKVRRLFELNQKVLRVVENAPELEATLSGLQDALQEVRTAVRIEGVSIQEWADSQSQRWEAHDRDRDHHREHHEAELRRLEHLILERVGPSPRSWLERIFGSGSTTRR